MLSEDRGTMDQLRSSIFGHLFLFNASIFYNLKSPYCVYLTERDNSIRTYFFYIIKFISKSKIYMNFHLKFKNCVQGWKPKFFYDFCSGF